MTEGDITRHLEFDAGHRIPNHASKCKHLHGHRYVIECTLTGAIHADRGQQDDGMVLDFGLVKEIMNRVVVEKWDHAFLVWEQDDVVCDMLATIPGHKTVVLSVVPTAENLARTAFDLLAPAIATTYGSTLHLKRVRLYETPNCWSDAYKR